jgi:RecB family exonuclease
LAFGNSIHNTLRDFHTENIFNHNVSYERMLELYKNNWDDSGYLDVRHRKQRFASGEKLLKAYYDKEKDHDKNIIEIEKNISFKLAGVKSSGRIDRIDRLDGNKIEIIDYKTGKLKEQKDVDKDLQTSIYALAVRETLGYEPEVLTLYFVEEGQRVSSHKTLEQIKEQVGKAEEVVEVMKSGDFTPTPGKHCEWCDYKNLCPFAQKGN